MMGFFRRLFAIGGKKQDKSDSDSGATKSRRKWSFTTARSSNPASKRCGDEEESLDAEKHAIAVAAATAAVAQAALAAAHAAAEVVRLTSGTVARGGDRAASSLSVTQIGWSKRRCWLGKEYVAAMKIQSAFRGYLARRALRALKALVKLQALVRGHIVRKQTADMLRRMQTLVRLQARARARAHARASRSSHVSDSFNSSSSFIPSSSPHSLHARCVSDADFREVVAMDHQRHHHSLYNGEDDTNDDKILQVDTWKPHYNSRTLRSDHHHHHHKEFPRKRQSLVVPPSVENSPQVRSRPGSSSGSRRKTPSPFTPTRSEYSGNSYYSGYHPNYMANTESYRAKVRSHSAPRQRLQDFSSESGYQRSLQGHYYYYTAAAERSFDQRSDTDRLSRNQSESSKIYSSFLNPASASLLF